MADDEGSDKEGGKGDGNGDKGGGRATASTVKKRARAARAMVTRVEGGGRQRGRRQGRKHGEDQRRWPRPRRRAAGRPL